MSISLTKALLGTLFVGASGLGIYGAYKLSSPDSIKTVEQLLKEDKTIVLLKVEGAENNSDWDIKVTELGDNSSADPRLERYTTQEGDSEETKRNKVKKICKDLFGSDSKEESKFNQAKKWCTKTVTVTPQG